METAADDAAHHSPHQPVPVSLDQIAVNYFRVLGDLPPRGGRDRDPIARLVGVGWADYIDRMSVVIDFDPPAVYIWLTRMLWPGGGVVCYARHVELSDGRSLGAAAAERPRPAPGSFQFRRHLREIWGRVPSAPASGQGRPPYIRRRASATMVLARDTPHAR
jgi:hypothetical protein